MMIGNYKIHSNLRKRGWFQAVNIDSKWVKELSIDFGWFRIGIGIRRYGFELHIYPFSLEIWR